MLKIKERNIISDKPQQLRAYASVYGPSSRQLEWGLWWIEHKHLLKNILLIILILVNLGLWGYGLSNLIFYAYSGIAMDDLLARDSVKSQIINHEIVAQAGAKPLSVGVVQIFRSFDRQTYDLAAEIKNVNSDWYATFDYVFVINQNAMPLKNDFIMPQEKKYLTYFLYEGSNSSDVRLEVSNIKWMRVNKHKIGNVSDYIASHQDIYIHDINLNPDVSSLIPVNYLNFTVRNNSPYNYRTVDFYITISANGRLTDINKYSLAEVMSEEDRNVSILWTGDLSGGKINIAPSINIFDEDNYLPFNLGEGQIK